MPRSLFTVDSFAPEAKPLRAVFDERFADPRKADPERFVWDFWHQPGQYTLLRTPAYHYFPSAIYRAFHERLVWWGRRTLGCHDISPPWLSCYVDGCRQELHGDLPHGPWAFVFSLTPWQRRVFRGGETLLLRPSVLDYWRQFASERSIEEEALIEEVAPRFNRLVVFDPRRPHGVRRVEGTLDPRQGRLVIHGWFVSPRPFVEGALPASAALPAIEAANHALAPFLDGGIPVAGIASFRLDVAPEGKVTRVTLLSDTTEVPGEAEPDRQRMVAAVRRALGKVKLAKRARPSTITLPLVFERA